jgi:D-serine dehydratase
MDVRKELDLSLKNILLSDPLVQKLVNQDPVFWCNPKSLPIDDCNLSLSHEEIVDASARLDRFSNYIAKVFPETQQTAGIIESPLHKIAHMQRALATRYDKSIEGELYLKCDNALAIAGSVKARGGIYEVLKQAETIALKHNLLSIGDDYLRFDSRPFKALFSQYSIVVGSTGNLGLSIGIMGAQLGFKVTVHMSADAREWKKQLLRTKGVSVKEYKDNYSIAVEQGRQEAETTKNCHFVDDENSEDLFLGYAVAALRLKQQLSEQGVIVDANHPLFVYLPCGVGGAPGGIGFGLKTIFGDQVHCFFAEPSKSPSMLLGMHTQLHDAICIQDIGLKGNTCADGLAVGRPSAFVGRFMQNILSGIYTVSDDEMYTLLALIKDTEDLDLEPSALAGVNGMQLLFKFAEDYIQSMNLQSVMPNATHIAWATGGDLVPAKERLAYYQIGKEKLGKQEQYL